MNVLKNTQKVLLGTTAVVQGKHNFNQSIKKKNCSVWVRKWIQRRENGLGVIHMLLNEIPTVNIYKLLF